MDPLARNLAGRSSSCIYGIRVAIGAVPEKPSPLQLLKIDFLQRVTYQPLMSMKMSRPKYSLYLILISLSISLDNPLFC